MLFRLKGCRRSNPLEKRGCYTMPFELWGSMAHISALYSRLAFYNPRQKLYTRRTRRLVDRHSNLYSGLSIPLDGKYCGICHKGNTERILYLGNARPSIVYSVDIALIGQHYAIVKSASLSSWMETIIKRRIFQKIGLYSVRSNMEVLFDHFERGVSKDNLQAVNVAAVFEIARSKRMA